MIGEDLKKTCARGSAAFTTIYFTISQTSITLFARRTVTKHRLAWVFPSVTDRSLVGKENRGAAAIETGKKRCSASTFADYKWLGHQGLDFITRRLSYGVMLPGAEGPKALYAPHRRRDSYVSADWFVYAASRTPLYHQVDGLPPHRQGNGKSLKGDW